MFGVTKDIRDSLPSCALYRPKSIRLIGTLLATNVAVVHTGHEINRDFKTCVATDSFFSANKCKPKQTKSANKFKFFSGLLKFILKQYRRFS